MLSSLLLLLSLVPSPVSSDLDPEHRDFLRLLAKDIRQMKYDIQDMADDNEEILGLLKGHNATTTEAPETTEESTAAPSDS